MLTWAKIALLLLQFAQQIMSGLQKRGFVNEGYQKAIAEANANMLRKNEYAKEIMERVSKLSSDDTDKLLRELEPPS